jgi:phenylalanyl-tRNA synthetase beta chain
MSWLRELVPVPAEQSGRDVAAKLIRAGLEVETVEEIGAGVSGPLTVGLVREIEELTEFKKPIRWCQVELADGIVNGIICGARNFSVGDLVVVATPGTTLPGDFTITARETYGKVSNGMICSERELGLGDDHSGIMILPPESAKPGDDAKPLIGIGDEILDIAVTPDRGYALSMRGIAREVGIAYGIPFTDPGQELVDLPAPTTAHAPTDCATEAPDGCDLITMRSIVGFDPQAQSPLWMKRRLVACGMRPVSLAVDVTNYVMLELGQPLHAYDLNKLKGTVRAAWATDGQAFESLDHVERTLRSDDLVIADDSGVIGLAGVIGGLHSEIDESTNAIALEAAHFIPEVIARAGRRHKVSSEAGRRNERGVDRDLAPYASARATALLLEFGGGQYVGMTAVEAPTVPIVIEMPASMPEEVAGMDIPAIMVIRILQIVGCTFADETSDVLEVTPPSWRPDLTDPADLVEEVLRLIGYDALPSTLPTAPLGRGLTTQQRLRRRIGFALASRGFTEVLSYPFVGEGELDQLLIPQGDSRRSAPRLANPLSEEQPFMRTTLLPGLLTATRRNAGRGNTDLALFELGRVFLGSVSSEIDVRPGVHARPSDEHWHALNELLPKQPEHLAGILTGAWEAQGWWGAGRPADWSDALSAVRVVSEIVGAEITVEAAADAMFHPGRCASIAIGEQVIGYAGELHPRVIEAAGLPERACAFEIDLDGLMDAATAVRRAPEVGTHPVAKEDLALVVDQSITAAEVEQALRAGAGELLESVRLFDVYEGPQVGEGKKSLAFALRFRAPDRTLSSEETAAARAGALSSAGKVCGATLR